MSVAPLPPPQYTTSRAGRSASQLLTCARSVSCVRSCSLQHRSHQPLLHSLLRRRHRSGAVRRRSNSVNVMISQQSAAARPAAPQHSGRCLLTTSITATSVAGALEELGEASRAGADVAELRLDFLADFDAKNALPALLQGSSLPVIVTFRPDWEGGNYSGPEDQRLRALWLAVQLGAAYVDVELKAAAQFFASSPQASGETSRVTKIILSSHNYTETPSIEDLCRIHRAAVAAGADIVKIAAMCQHITDVHRLQALLTEERTRPTIALGMGEAGQVSRILAPKFGSYLTFGALRVGKESAPGQTTMQQLIHTFRLREQGPTTRVLGVIGNPISHSRSPLIHNAALDSVGLDMVYVPLKVDDLRAFLKDPTFSGPDFVGFSVTIPHKETALQCASKVDSLAEGIGAVNTLLRGPDGSYSGFNTDCTAALDAIEEGLKTPLAGRTVVVVGAGGAGRAIAFGAANRGAKVVIANRNFERAQNLASTVGGHAVEWSVLQSGGVKGDVLANTTSLGMFPEVGDTPVPANALKCFSLVFDAVYNPLETRLLREAKAAGALTVDGLQMFIGQAAEQFRIFTGSDPPVDLMRTKVLTSLT